ncbi:family 43 glycosylhydrolase [Muricomes sp. OA1]|uniref:Xylosidase n=1 Tax=Hungatella hathewayi TaxID=154046 RepID=A0A3E2WXI9_9FIRM|nr:MULTISPECIES: family 43 glycosylhydrolase [Clostridia]MCH1971406.1 family 43 glycosylhydrolase [Muricomes sp. OA1]RGC32668.1 xylosidase [Hungatella hathewayi]GKH34702.1 hypothetical protein CE91St64_41090 [Faecalicatena contorta]
METYVNKRNPILPLQYHVPDSEGHVMPDGSLYLYGSYDDKDGAFCSEKYHVVSTPDMEHWTIHDESLNGNEIPWFGNPDAPKYPGVDLEHLTPFVLKMIQIAREKGGGDLKLEDQFKSNEVPFLYAPDCIEKNGRYYLYFCMADDSEGVAISDRPEGPFKEPKQLPCGGIDPAVFVDDDGQAYFYWGQLASHGVKLNPDMVSFDEDSVVDNLVREEEHFFHEGSSMRRIGDTYYYIYADMERGKPTALGYSTSKSPLGPFEYRGIIIDNADCDPASWNNHGSIECVNGQWYVFYHRCSRGVKENRRLCIEPITILPDGSIPEVKMTSQGVGEPFAPGERIMGYQACALKGSAYIGLNKDAAASEMYPEVITNIGSGDEVVFRYIKNDERWNRIEMVCAGSGRIKVYMDDAFCGDITIADGLQSGGKLNADAGKYELRLSFEEANELEIFELTLY